MLKDFLNRILDYIFLIFYLETSKATLASVEVPRVRVS